MANTAPKKKHSSPSHRNAVALPDIQPAPSMAVPSSEDYLLDHLLHAGVAKLTGNLSPASLGLARHDWSVHLAFSPDKMLSLQKSLLAKTAQLGWYGMQAAAGKEVEPLAVPSPGDQRFKSEGWQRWPFNFMYQSFLLYEDWWEEATTGVRGMAPHHQDVVSFTARQWLVVFSSEVTAFRPFMRPPVRSSGPAPRETNCLARSGRMAEPWLPSTASVCFATSTEPPPLCRPDRQLDKPWRRNSQPTSPNWTNRTKKGWLP